MKICSFFIMLLSIAPYTYSQNNKNDNQNEFSAYISEYNEAEIKNTISHHPYTIIYAWTKWCAPCRKTMKEEVVPFLKIKNNAVGFVSVCYGNKEEVTKLLQYAECKFPTYQTTSKGSLDYFSVNKMFKNILVNYKSVGYVPVVILCDSKGKILNTNSEYYSFESCLSKLNELNVNYSN